VTFAHLVPTRDEFTSIVSAALDHAMARGMSYADAQEIRWAAMNANMVAWRRDTFAGASCPLRLAGFERDWAGGWNAQGAAHFEAIYDGLMQRRVLPGPGMCGIRDVPAPIEGRR
jgi:hypothetical protein